MSEERQYGENGEYTLPSGKQVVLCQIGGLDYRRIANKAGDNSNVTDLLMIVKGVKEPRFHMPKNLDLDADEPVPEGYTDMNSLSILDLVDLVQAVYEYSGLKEALEKIRPFEIPNVQSGSMSGE